MKRIKTLFGLLLVLIAITLAAGDALAAGKDNAYGMLTSIEDDGTVVIDGKGYMLDRAASIVGYEKGRISIRDISLPARVYFEYEYTKQGPVIKLLQDTPQ